MQQGQNIPEVIIYKRNKKYKYISNQINTTSIIVGRTYSHCNIGCWNKTNESCQKENVEGYINDRRCQVDKKIWQCWSYPQEKHVIQ